MDNLLKLNKAKTSLKGSITRIQTFLDNLSEDVNKTLLDIKLKKIDQLQKKLEELKEISFGIETATPTEEAEFEDDLDNCEIRLEDLELQSETNERGLSPPPIQPQTLTKQEDGESEVINPSTLNTVLNNAAAQRSKNVLISTGSIFLRNNEGRELKCSVIFDSASNTNIISRKMCDFLGIAIEKINTSVSGLNSMKQNLKGKMNTLISNTIGSFRENIEFFGTEKITGVTPSVTLDISEIKIPQFLELSDPYFYEAKEIHALLNADIFFRIIKDNVYRVNEVLLFRGTEFGWIAGGRLQEKSNLMTFRVIFLNIMILLRIHQNYFVSVNHLT
ncbi:uncharacterized protein TNCT_718121 [Trichonephila clavata]|uniref:Peptidase aspartic putative domain-containing protein n=1 Tax=Trichonephila clavata TaxID=2740835 RepID=A0A8X6H5B0_TRICU|nr:uncharacterized protein TNCT_718121 [Trichonephila clavata]